MIENTQLTQLPVSVGLQQMVFQSLLLMELAKIPKNTGIKLSAICASVMFNHLYSFYMCLLYMLKIYLQNLTVIIICYVIIRCSTVLLILNA